MQITVNGDPQTLADGLTVADLVLQFNLTPERVAVEVNEHLVRRTEYVAVHLANGDRVEIVTLVGGG